MIRILYAYPSYFSEELIDAIADIPQVAKYIDIPLQHITNLSLLRMNRPPRQHTEDLLYKLRERIHRGWRCARRSSAASPVRRRRSTRS